MLPRTQYQRLVSRTQTAYRNLEFGKPKELSSLADMVKRRRDTGTQISVQVVGENASASVKANQAWKYPNNKIVRAPSVYLGAKNRFYTDPKADDSRPDMQGVEGVEDRRPDLSQPRRKQESSFFITINPNKAYKDALTQAQAEQRVANAIRPMAEDPSVLATLFMFGPVSTHYKNDFAEDVIEPNVEFRARVETGEKKNRVHAHIWLTVTHYSQIQMDRVVIEREFTKAYNNGLSPSDPAYIKNRPYVQIKLLPQSSFMTIMKQYLNKSMLQI